MNTVHSQILKAVSQAALVRFELISADICVVMDILFLESPMLVSGTLKHTYDSPQWIGGRDPEVNRSD